MNCSRVSFSSEEAAFNLVRPSPIGICFSPLDLRSSFNCCSCGSASRFTSEVDGRLTFADDAIGTEAAPGATATLGATELDVAVADATGASRGNCRTTLTVGLAIGAAASPPLHGITRGAEAALTYRTGAMMVVLEPVANIGDAAGAVAVKLLAVMVTHFVITCPALMVAAWPAPIVAAIAPAGRMSVAPRTVCGDRTVVTGAFAHGAAAMDCI
mmetsp:Transcript_52499/g.151279  ORF Transcript_52499/g.151279 Transcript_52499/m.151279 type:complete len:214 (+) Transcript_52499:557-1198(+)